MKVGQQFTTYINPLLAVLKGLGGSARSAEAKAAVANHLALSDAVLEERLPSGSSRYENQVSWARYYLVQGGFIDSSRRGVWALTEKGRNTSTLSQTEIAKLVQNVVAEWRASRTDQDAESLETATETRSPDEPVGDASTKLLDVLRRLPASGFEQVIVTGRSGDGGIDGTGLLEVNPFVSFKVLFQCKRYVGAVPPAMVRDFRGAMMGRADKGIIMTTGSFSAESKREAIRDGVPPIELVDGEKLVALFEKLELGLAPRTTYDIVPAFFDEFRD